MHKKLGTCTSKKKQQLINTITFHPMFPSFNQKNMKKIITAILLISGFFAFAQQKQKTDTAKVQDIQEVSVTKKLFQKTSDRFVYDVSQSPAAKGNTAFGLLKETPLVSSTDDKTLQILGKSNAIIYINGRKTNMNSEAISELMKSTPAENISKIEVITVPGSEFNVESSDGIINIILKKKLDDGINGNFRMSNNQNKFNRQTTAVSLNARKDKLGISTSISGSNWTTGQQYVLKNGTPTTFNVSEGPVYDPNLNLGGYLNIDYELTEKQNIALSWNSSANRSYGSEAELFNTVTKPWGVEYIRTFNLEDARTYNNSVNLNYELKTDDAGSKLNANVAYLKYKRFQRSTNSSYQSNLNRETLELRERFNQRTPQLIDNYSATLDYIKKFDKNMTLAVGGNFSKTDTDNDTWLANLDIATGSLIRDDNQSHHFVYNEEISGLYATLEKKFSDNFSAKIGTRFENTNSYGEIINSSQTISRNYNNLLPYASFSYNINDSNNLSYTFSSRVRRPSFWEINPVRTYLTPTNYVQNNPFVKPSDVYSNQLTYMFKQSYFLILGHTLQKDDYSQVPLQNGEEMRYIRTNFGDKNNINLFVGTQKTLFKGMFTTKTNVGFQINHINGYLDTDPISGDKFDPFTIDTRTTSFAFQTNNTVRLSSKKDLFMNVGFFYVGPQILNIGILEPISSLDVGLRKIWNDWTFNLQAKDILGTNVVKIEDTQSNGNYNYVMNDQFNQSLEFSVTYNFGNKKLKKVREINDASSGIKDRTGN